VEAQRAVFASSNPTESDIIENQESTAGQPPKIETQKVSSSQIRINIFKRVNPSHKKPRGLRAQDHNGTKDAKETANSETPRVQERRTPLSIDNPCGIMDAENSELRVYPSTSQGSGDPVPKSAEAMQKGALEIGVDNSEPQSDTADIQSSQEVPRPGKEKSSTPARPNVEELSDSIEIPALQYQDFFPASETRRSTPKTECLKDAQTQTILIQPPPMASGTCIAGCLMGDCYFLFFQRPDCWICWAVIHAEENNGNRTPVLLSPLAHAAEGSFFRCLYDGNRLQLFYVPHKAANSSPLAEAYTDLDKNPMKWTTRFFPAKSPADFLVPIFPRFINYCGGPCSCLIAKGIVQGTVQDHHTFAIRRLANDNANTECSEYPFLSRLNSLKIQVPAEGFCYYNSSEFWTVSQNEVAMHTIGGEKAEPVRRNLDWKGHTLWFSGTWFRISSDDGKDSSDDENDNNHRNDEDTNIGDNGSNHDGNDNNIGIGGSGTYDSGNDRDDESTYSCGILCKDTDGDLYFYPGSAWLGLGNPRLVCSLMKGTKFTVSYDRREIIYISREGSVMTLQYSFGKEKDGAHFDSPRVLWCYSQLMTRMEI